MGAITVASLVLSPQANTWVGWTPRSRNVKREKAVFIIKSLPNCTRLQAGVIEGAHNLVRHEREAFGGLVWQLPTGVTITDVADASQSETRKANPLVSLWRLNTDARKLRVTLTAVQTINYHHAVADGGEAVAV